MLLKLAICKTVAFLNVVNNLYIMDDFNNSLQLIAFCLRDNLSCVECLLLTHTHMLIACMSVCVWQRSHIVLPTIKFLAEVDINDIPTFYLTDNCYCLYPSVSAVICSQYRTGLSRLALAGTILTSSDTLASEIISNIFLFTVFTSRLSVLIIDTEKTARARFLWLHALQIHITLQSCLQPIC